MPDQTFNSGDSRKVGTRESYCILTDGDYHSLIDQAYCVDVLDTFGKLDHNRPGATFVLNPLL
jgi:hypothetical protein